MSKNNIDLKINPEERSPVVMMLLSVIDTLQTQLASQSAKMDLLLEEIRRLKKNSSKPKLSASKLPKDPDDDDGSSSSGNNNNNETKYRELYISIYRFNKIF